MPGKFVLTKGSGNTWRFDLLATNGKVIVSSETYRSRRAALAGIESVRRNAPAAHLVEEAARAE